MKIDEKLIIKAANLFLIIGIVGAICFIINEIFLVLDLLNILTFNYSKTISGIAGIISGILLYNILKNIFKNIEFEENESIKGYNNAKLFIIFYPIASCLTIGLDFFLLLLPSPIPTITILALCYGIIVIIFIVLSFIGLIFMGLYIYNLGKEVEQQFIKIGGILLIFLPWAGGILLYIGFSKYQFELEI
ncbi:MAG: DUF973 family protein [Candidatus Helarchaeota archaeon]